MIKYYPQSIDCYEVCNQIIAALEESEYGNSVLSTKVKEDREGIHIVMHIDDEITSYELSCIKAICEDIDGVLA